MEEEAPIEGENTKELAPALIAVHPLEKYVVVAIGSELRVFDLGEQHSILLSDNTSGPSHSDAIRAICFGAKGRYFASAGDDKLVKIWMTDSWQCVRTVCSEKRVSAVAISHDGMFVSFADKFGVVWVSVLDEDGDNQASVDKKAVPMLGHYCSIITSLEFSPDGQFIATADRDSKIRITKFPRRPLNGAHEIQSFCLGHTECPKFGYEQYLVKPGIAYVMKEEIQGTVYEVLHHLEAGPYNACQAGIFRRLAAKKRMPFIFVSSLSFLSSLDYPKGFLLSGGGDATVRLWDYISGCLLDTCEVGTKAGLVASNEAEKEVCPAVTDIHSFPEGSLVAVAIQSLNGVILLKCELSARTLSVAKVVSVEGSFVPTRIGLNPSAGLLWMIMGASNLPTSVSTPLLVRLRVISGLHKCLSDSEGDGPVVLEDNEIPRGENLLATLQGSLDVSKEEGTLAATAAALKVAMHNLLIKKQYSVEKRELRKKSRNDRKQKM